MTNQYSLGTYVVHNNDHYYRYKNNDWICPLNGLIIFMNEYWVKILFNDFSISEYHIVLFKKYYDILEMK
jgi:hypothetical protein